MAEIQDVMNKLEDVLEKLDVLEDKMGEDKSIQKICTHCKGDGLKASGNKTEGEPYPCPDCNSDGVRPWGRITARDEE